MELLSTSLDGLKLIKPRVFNDERGSLVKLFSAADFEGKIQFNPVESFYSSSKKNVIRGMHFQAPPFQQAKVVYVTRGSILDVVLDIRIGSPTYGKYFSTELSSNNHFALFIPDGFAHGFVSLSDEAQVQYLLGSVYNPEAEGGIRYDSIGVSWGLDKPELSQRDLNLPQLQEFDSPFNVIEMNQLAAERTKKNILSGVKDYYDLTHAVALNQPFDSEKSRVNYAGRVFDELEMQNLVESSLEFWLTSGKYSKQFEAEFSKFLGVKHCILTNSGSSANLLAFAALTSPELAERQILPGDEILSVATCFPTTIAPIIQYGAVPVFLDIDLTSANVNVSQLEAALSPKTKAIVLAHNLGNPFDIEAVQNFCNKHKLWLIEDNCDALGSRFNGRLTGSFGDIATSSFYPPHHITMGEGGAVYTNNKLLSKLICSLRDWGRDCWCDSGKDNTCGKRFNQEFSSLPEGYDHKYVYSRFGYNLKLTDLQASIGCEQIKKLSQFTEQRRVNFSKLKKALSSLVDVFHFPEETMNSEPSWFGFLIVLKDDLSFTRKKMVEFLEKNRIQTRSLFAGNILRQPCFSNLKNGKDYRVVGSLKVSDKIMNDAFWLGVYPGLKDAEIEYMAEKIKLFVREQL